MGKICPFLRYRVKTLSSGDQTMECAVFFSEKQACITRCQPSELVENTTYTKMTKIKDLKGSRD